MSVLVNVKYNNLSGYYLAKYEFTINDTPFKIIKSEITGTHLHDVNHTIKNQLTGKTKTLSMTHLIQALKDDYK